MSLIALSGCNDHDHDDLAASPNTSVQQPKILLIGHRGASALRPEHTLASYQKPLMMALTLLNQIWFLPKMGYWLHVMKMKSAARPM